MWLLFAILAGTFSTGESLVQRFVLRQQKDSWAFAFFYSLVGTLISLPFMLAAPKIPHDPRTWLLAVLVGLLIVGNNLLLFRSSNFIEASLAGALLKLRLVWVFLLGLLFLHNPFSWQQLAGTLLAVLAGVIIIGRFRKPKSTSGISLVLTATIFNASVIILSKYLLGSFNAVSLTFFVSFLPATVIVFIVTPRALPRITKLFREDGPVVILACALGTLTNLALNFALSLRDATSVVVINEAFLVLVLVGEHVFLKEKEHAWIKFASVVLAISGAVLIELVH